MFNVKDIPDGVVVNIIYDTPILLSEMRVVALGTCGYELARQYEDINAKQKNIYSSLVAQPEDNTARYTYLIFKDSKGKMRVAADAWIRSVNIIKNLNVRFNITIDSRDEIDEITKALAARGIDNVNYEIIDNMAG